jgi:hypothetical protein
MQLRDLLSYRRHGDTGHVATVATVATVSATRSVEVPTVARVATVATLPEPESWADRLRTLVPAASINWRLAADALDMLLRAGVVEKALRLGWDARELVGICRSPPHDSPSRAGLVWSLRPDDTVPDVRRSGCIIAIAGSNVRHIWKRAPIGADICLPWDVAPGPAPRHLGDVNNG